MCDFANKFSELLNLDSGFYDIILLRLLLVKQKKVFSLQKVENDSYYVLYAIWCKTHDSV